MSNTNYIGNSRFSWGKVSKENNFLEHLVVRNSGFGNLRVNAKDNLFEYFKIISAASSQTKNILKNNKHDKLKSSLTIYLDSRLDLLPSIKLNCV